MRKRWLDVYLYSKKVSQSFKTTRILPSHGTVDPLILIKVPRYCSLTSLSFSVASTSLGNSGPNSQGWEWVRPKNSSVRSMAVPKPGPHPGPKLCLLSCPPSIFHFSFSSLCKTSHQFDQSTVSSRLLKRKVLGASAMGMRKIRERECHLEQISFRGKTLTTLTYRF